MPSLPISGHLSICPPFCPRCGQHLKALGSGTPHHQGPGARVVHHCFHQILEGLEQLGPCTEFSIKQCTQFPGRPFILRLCNFFFFWH